MAASDYDITIIMAPMWSIREPWLAPAYVCEALRKEGWRVQFHDYNIALYHVCRKLDYASLWSDAANGPWIGGELSYLAAWIDLEEIKGDVVGFSTTCTNLAFSIALARRVRERFPHKKIIFGGHQMSVLTDVAKVPLDVVDALCVGEGEHTVCEVMACGFSQLEQIPGLSLPSEDGWRSTTARSPEEDLDALAWPTFSDIDLSQYGKRFLPTVGSRGCIGRCIFCSDRCNFPGYRCRSAISQVDELEYLNSHFDVEHFPYNDSLLNGDLAIMEQKADEILRRGLQVRYGGNMMVRKDMSPDLLAKLRRSGLCVALMGIESGSAVTLRAMRKKHTPAMAEQFLKDCHEAGIRTEINLIVGFPSETEEQFEETRSFIRRNAVHIDTVISATTFCLMPSDLYDRLDDYGIVQEEGGGMQQWHTRDGANTFAIRRQRLEKLIAEIETLGLSNRDRMSDVGARNAGEIPSPRTLMEQYRKSADPSVTPEHCARILAEAERLRARMVFTPSLGNPAEIVRRVLDNLRRRGLAQTVRRGREWLALRRR